MTLKVSTIETTAESVDATGGWGNPKLITWDLITIGPLYSNILVKKSRELLENCIKAISSQAI